VVIEVGNKAELLERREHGFSVRPCFVASVVVVA
jgi:hypothetical protein